MNKLKFIGAFLLSLLLDQITKIWAAGFVSLQYNSGVSLSWLPGSNQLTLTVILSVFLIGIAWSWREVWVRYPFWSGLFFGAAISNLLDRMMYSGVRDWLTLPGLNLKNNVADWCVCLSLGYILVQILKQKRGPYAD